MIEPYIQDLVADVEYELFVLQKVAPVLLSAAEETPSSYDIEQDRMNVTRSVHSTAGMSLDQAVELLGIRPLAFGAAWKVVDLLLEYAFTTAGLHPQRGTRWTIIEKRHLAQQAKGSARPLSGNGALWSPLLACYAATEEMRHSLVHRRATSGTGGEVLGVDAAQQPLPPLTKEQQLSFIRAVQRAMTCLRQGQISGRQERALLAELDGLSALTGIKITGYPVVAHPPAVVRVPVAAGQVVDFKALRTRLQATFSSTPEVDVLFEVGGDSFEAAVEEIPDTIEPFTKNLPWLT